MAIVLPRQKFLILILKMMETNVDKFSNRRRMKKYAFGVVVILAGILLLIFNMGGLPAPWKHVIFSWQMLLITIGVISLFGKESNIPGIILVTVGVIFIIPRMGLLPFPTSQLIWPAILIAIGLVVLFKGFGSHRFGHREGNLNLEDGYINEENIFGGSKIRVTHQEFKGGKISCIFGGTEVDMTQATLAPGEHILEINAIFGGTTLIIPSDWKIILKNSSVLGGFADKRTWIKEQPDPTRALIIKANAVFGGGEIKSH
jgi:predicted membrane protein